MSSHDVPVEMSRGSFSDAAREGDLVLRRRPRNGAAVEQFLTYLRSQGCTAVPEFVGLTEHQRQAFSYIDGETGYPPYPASLLSDETLASIARLVRRIHDAGAGYEWGTADWTGNEVARPAAADCIGHNDLAPWNIVFQNGEAVAVIDWDTAGPSSRVWDLSYLAHHVVPFHSNDSVSAWGWASTPDRARRLRVFLTAYGGDYSPTSIVDTAIVRLSAMGAKIQHSGDSDDPDYAEQYAQGQAEAYLNAARDLIEMRDSIVAQ